MLINKENKTEMKKTTSNSQNINNKKEFYDSKSIDFRQSFTSIRLIEFEKKNSDILYIYMLFCENVVMQNLNGFILK